ncbi:exported protein of unknown function [Acetoanaerobium sticklandii]|uniref:Uncharacterized protein n=1 Tax=Acetoanaerobium sticklandii (strain ATCC 12662 / DSM 519 / JCM 1433 / CCUG 9281 / NCIMB 10654 / HF) TaxID=499177 RepID=E3PVT6_ACESD|nr:hypothetical protein [Acetoanaerobium sticklandii]CBH22639.1 exported protein of unknown function [Acetoanaerobium sticklandii]
MNHKITERIEPMKIFKNLIPMMLVISLALSGCGGATDSTETEENKETQAETPQETAGSTDVTEGQEEEEPPEESVSAVEEGSEDEAMDSNEMVENSVIVESIRLDEWGLLETIVKNNSSENVKIKETNIKMTTLSGDVILPLDDRLAQTIEIPANSVRMIETLFGEVNTGIVTEILVYDIDNREVAKLEFDTSIDEYLAERSSAEDDVVEDSSSNYESISVDAPSNGILSDIVDQAENLVDQNNEYVVGIKASEIHEYESITYGEAFEYFFGSPAWIYFEGVNGEKVVEFSGYCTVEGVEVKANLQFLISSDGNYFEVGALNFNGVPQSQLLTGMLINQAFEEYKSSN